MVRINYPTRTVQPKHHMHSQLMEDRIKEMERENEQYQQPLAVPRITLHVQMRGCCSSRNGDYMNTQRSLL